MTTGGLFKKIMIFAIPLIISNVLQLLFNAADIVVVGRYVGPGSLAAVGSTSYLVGFFINFFIGVSVGVNVLVARFFGAHDERNVRETVQTALISSVIAGAVLAVVCFFLAYPLLRMISAPEDVIDQAALYFKIYFAGSPAVVLYNFGAAILRAVGDTRRPLYYLLAGGLINVPLNIFFVAVLGMDASGVAAATVIAQTISALLVVRCLMKTEGTYRFDLRTAKLFKDKLIGILRLGVPSGVQSSLFSVSNMLIQSAVNTFGTIAVAGNTAASNLEGFGYVSMGCIYQAALSFTSQNIGAGKIERVRPVLWNCLGIVTALGAAIGLVMVFYGPRLLSLYTGNVTVIYYGMDRLDLMAPFIFACGAMDVVVGSSRGMGASMQPTIVTMIGVCVLRVVWVYTVFSIYPTLFAIYVSYPVSWIVTGVVHFICNQVLYKKLKKSYGMQA